MSKPLILVTGKNGQLGNELQHISKSYDQYDFIFTDVAELDISNKEQVNLHFKEHKPFACLNAAAYTAVDKAETEQETALTINAEAVSHLAENCNKYGTRLVQVSTDYVFDGNGSAPYLETDEVSPVNYYGYTKLKGEEAALKNDLSVIIRTSWVYSYYGKNFVKTMMKLMSERDSINVIYDQFGSPTYAADLAYAVMEVATAHNFHKGIYHFSNEGDITWYEFAVAIRKLAKLDCNVNPIDTVDYPTPAKRPAYSVMSKEKITSTFGLQLKPWKESLATCIKLLNHEARQ